MIGYKITRRFVSSILLVVCISLTGLGFFLLNFFREHTMQKEQDNLILNARIIETTLADKLWRNDSNIIDVTNVIARDTGLRITVLDKTGRVIVDTDKPIENLDNHLLRQEIQQALSSDIGYGTAIRYSDTLHENFMYTAIPVRRNGELIGIIRTATSISVAEAAYAKIKFGILIALLLAIPIAFTLALWLASRQLKPLIHIIRTAKNISNGNLSCRIHLHTGDEFEFLGHALNKLTSTLAKKIREAQTDAQKVSMILEQMDNALMLIDTAGNIHSANRQACRLFPILQDNQPHHCLHVLGNAEFAETIRTLNQSTSMILTYRDYTFEVFLSAFQNNDDAKILAVFHDISVMHELNRRQAEFTGNAAHELATPLTSISGFAELLREDDFSSPVDSRHYADVIFQQAQRMNRLINDLLQLTKLENKTYRNQLPSKIIDCGSILQKAVNALRQKSAEKNQVVTISELADNAKIKAAPDLLEQILRNLIDNAIKYTPEHGTITVACFVRENQVICQIQDTGIGIPQESLSRIFDRFYRVDKARDRKSGGNGIGLALVKFLVELFDGSIEVTSTLGKGSNFKIFFPLIKSTTPT
ncbi:MAG: cell wall metabolism sensor histidine kinase WalK [Selenomonadaceae bacterium]|nr:cell wall metabolism sensor histidine kinase WalK [Selenomonadaceae bacterium]